MQLTGWVNDPQAVDEYLGKNPHPIFGATAASLKDTGRGKTVLLHKIVASVLGYFPIYLQQIGDCVSFGWAQSIDAYKCVQIAIQKQNYDFKAPTATEAIYGSSRVEIGRGRLGNQDGSCGAWAAEAVQRYGTLLRQTYQVGANTVDLRKYSGQRAKQWGAPRAGLPDWLEPTSRQHPVRTVSLIRTYEEARDAIANGSLAPVCSSIGFVNVRDREGFAKPGPRWDHCMYFVAVDDAYRRPGLLCVNSWGPDWISGPIRLDQPPGSFWVDADVVNRMLAMNDSYAISGYEGFPKLTDAVVNMFI